MYVVVESTGIYYIGGNLADLPDHVFIVYDLSGKHVLAWIVIVLTNVFSNDHSL